MFRYRCIRRGSCGSAAHLLRRQIAIGLVAFLAVPFGGGAPVFAQQTAPAQQPSGMPPPPEPSHNDAPPPDATQTPGGNQASPVPNAPQQQQPSGSSTPLGTAVAPYEKGTGIAASRPAGAVIAPAKQKRTRSFMIKVGVLIGAAVAVGTVVGLSSASPSRPH
jgi:hypothetical protein